MKKSNKIMTIILSMLLMISGFFTMPFKKVSADDSEIYTSFYYFSDNPNCTTYYNGFMDGILDGYGMTEANRHLYNWSARSDSFTEGLTLFFNEQAYSTISNALIVFEISKALPKQDSSREVTIATILNNMFADMNDNGCKIMFICDTDESRFSFNNSNAFLSEVDIHINTDLVTPIAEYLINKMEENADLDENGYLNFTGTTFIIHENAQKIFLEYIVPYFEGEGVISHNSIMDNDGSASLNQKIEWISIELYYNRRMNVFFRHEGEELPYYTNGFHYRNTSRNVYYYFDEIMAETGEGFNHTIDPQKTYAIGAVYSNADEAKQDIDMWSYDLEYIESPVTFPICIHNVSNSVINGTLDCLYEAGVSKYYFYYDESDEPVISEDGDETAYGSFVAIFNDFVNGENLSIYDNMIGLCPITHKTIVISENGWLPINISPRECWNLYADL